MSGHGALIGELARQHVELTALAVALGLVISLPLAVAVHRLRPLTSPVLAATGTLYTIPSLALFALLVPWTGLSRTTALIGLTSYTLLILVRNTLAGLDGVPAEVRDAATGMGYGRLRRLLAVELPLAVPVIMAGVRIATVTTIGLVTVAALIGHGGLGQLILDGLNRDFRTPLVVGSALSVAMAAIADVALLGLQRRLTPWAGGE
ncbi:MAG: ABC transporter permease [Actinobacteria bacterium]|nr:ABC transporter permease [Actinomycetota bacterium]MBW3641654.1 ABC transporter permease [Actinomycetota bacterium]